jgi:hypothetical protein
MAYPQGYDKEEFGFGSISSIQDDESGILLGWFQVTGKATF